MINSQRTRIYAKGPSSTGYEDYPLGSMDLGSPIITTEFDNAGTGSGTTNADLAAFMTSVKSQSNGVGSYGIYEDIVADI